MKVRPSIEEIKATYLLFVTYNVQFPFVALFFLTLFHMILNDKFVFRRCTQFFSFNYSCHQFSTPWGHW